ncbi:MAG TPA: glycosyltransferase family 39 protein [Rhizomicrobium sp.]|nr:glycosyltransferase family 39 protein [Rhizomicrobium sp.]
MIPARVSLALVLLLIVIRGVVAALLPLSADEAYYWLWSKHLAAGYFDHPPMIAWLIRAGTALFGDTPWGVRVAGVILSLPASWFVWRAAAAVMKDENRAAFAALLFNLTLMASIELLAATPDMPSTVTAAAFVYFLCQVQASGKAPYWMGAGIAAGLGLLSKFSMLFLGAGAFVWLLADPKARRWLATPWPWIAALLALLIFVPNLLWQSCHHWETFAFQFGRIGTGHFTLRFLGEFIAAQFGLATPLIFALMAAGLWRATRFSSDRFLLAMLSWVGLCYFLEHALHDRVQGNWPCFLYPALAILAADAFAAPAMGRQMASRQNVWWRKLSMIAAPLAAVFLLAVYAQALYAPVPLRKDPLARLLGRDFMPIGDVAAALIRAHLAEAIVTTDYETTAWLRFLQPGVPVIQVTEAERYPDAPAPSSALLQSRLIYLTEFRRDQHHLVQRDFAYTGFPTQLQAPSSLYMLYPVGRPRGSRIGKMP